VARGGALAEEALRRRRSAAQLLDRPRRRAPGDLVRHLTGVQAQVLPAAGESLRARTGGLTAETVDEARERDRSIVLTWAMRGTLHLIAPEDHAWLVPLSVEPRVPNAFRRLAQEGVMREEADRAVELIERTLAREGPLTRSALADALRARGIRTAGQAMAHLTWLAAARSVICCGPGRGRQLTFVLVEDWIGRRPGLTPDEAERELAVRYLRAHGPATPEDLASWAGIPIGQARRAWRDLSGRLVEIPTAAGPAWSLRRLAREAPRGVTRLLPAFDEYLLGWKDRGRVASARDQARINRGGGWIHPVLLVDGRAVGTWASSRGPKGFGVEVRPFGSLADDVIRAVGSDAADLARYRGSPLGEVTMAGP
jgi:Winged helix DNA-binding domain